jgi:glycosyltransferase involved in cell wall biosynthesis
MKIEDGQPNRLVIYLPTLVGGGAERVMINLATGFIKRGVTVDFVLAQREGAFVSAFPNTVPLVELNHKQKKFGRSVLSLPALVKYLRHERPDALLTGLHANIIAIWAKRLSGVPFRVIITEHNTISMARKTQPKAFGLLSNWLIRKNYPKADRIVAVSEGVADDLAAIARIDREKIKVIANPVITPEMIAKTKEPINHPWFAAGQPPVILAIGRFTAQKDFPLLIRAFADVNKETPCRLMILGDGPDRSELLTLVHKLQLEKEVSMPGFVQNPYPYLVNAGLFVLSSKWEGLPTVLVEALYCGTPLVATNCQSGPVEILKNGKYGELVPVGNQKSLTEAILNALKKPRISPPEESWQPYTEDYVNDQYVKLLFGNHS